MILYRKKTGTLFVLAVLLLTLVLTTGCQPATLEGEEEMTMDEVSQYDGQDGRAAYVVLDGVIYDVTAMSEWEGGVHTDGHASGQDLTDELGGVDALRIRDYAPVVGTVIEE